MKRFYLLGLLALLATNFSYAQSDNVQNNPELTITEDQKRLEATVYCVDIQMEVAPHNEFARQFVSLPGFPQNSPTLTKEQLHTLVDQYFKDHAELVDQVRAERKKAHDKLYGHRPY